MWLLNTDAGDAFVRHTRLPVETVQFTLCSLQAMQLSLPLVTTNKMPLGILHILPNSPSTHYLSSKNYRFVHWERQGEIRQWLWTRYPLGEFSSEASKSDSEPCLHNIDFFRIWHSPCPNTPAFSRLDCLSWDVTFTSIKILFNSISPAWAKASDDVKQPTSSFEPFLITYRTPWAFLVKDHTEFYKAAKYC